MISLKRARNSRTGISRAKISLRARLGVAIIGIIALFGVTFWSVTGTNTHPVFADTASCLASSGASSVPSVQYACSHCGSGSRGTLWVNGSSTNKNSAVVQITDASATKVTAYLWGQVYSCGSWIASSNTALYIWFGSAGSDAGDGYRGFPNQVDFLSLPGGDKLYRGTGQGLPNTWFQPANNRIAVTLDVQKFLNYSGTTCTAPNENGIRTCTAKVSINRCNNNLHGRYLSPTADQTCYGDDSEIKLEIPAAEATGTFGAYSWVKSDVSSQKQTYTPDNRVEDTITTTQDRVDVSFWHQLKYDGPSNVPAGSTFTSTNTDWDVQITKDGANINNTPGANSLNGNVVVANGGQVGFWSSWLAQNTIRVDVPTSGSVKVCSKINYHPKFIKWKAAGDTNNYQVNGTSGEASSESCITITRGDNDEENGGRIRFWSTSYIDIPAQNGDVKAHSTNSISTADKKEVSIKLSTDSDHLNVNFWHNLFYNHEGVTDFYPNDELPSDACTTYEVTRTSQKYIDSANESAPETAVVKSSTPYCITGHSGSDEVSRTNNYLIENIARGETVKVCQKISFQPEIINLKREKVYRWDPDGQDRYGNTIYKKVFDHWKYTKTSEYSSGYSSACVEVTRPGDPVPSPEKGVFYNTGTSSTYPMFAGETSSVGYDIQAKGYMTRRIMAWRADTFQVQVGQAFNANTIKGNINGARTTLDPCAYYVAKFGSSMRGGCGVIGGSSFGAYGKVGVHATGREELGIIVPNLVGDKYCDTAGYYWAYWTYIEYEDGSGEWINEHNEYWTNYDAACISIAKKPTLELWNGGIFSGNGSVATTLAPRNDPADATSISAASATTSGVALGIHDHVFGSWAEHLVVVDGEVKNLSSGARLALGPDTTDALVLSPLTIANTGETIGYSGVSTNSAVASRLATYFIEDKIPENLRVSQISDLYSSITTSKIYRSSSDVTISNNIKIDSASAYDSVYNLPQVVIYTEGNIYIDPNVEQIDAWLIAPNGVVNTCGNTDLDQVFAAQVNGASGNTTCSKSLIVNGPVFAQKIVANRTYGADGISNNDQNKSGSADARAASAEIFNLGADTYLWAFAQAGRYQSSYVEAYTRELPPRY